MINFVINDSTDQPDGNQENNIPFQLILLTTYDPFIIIIPYKLCNNLSIKYDKHKTVY